ncbi:MAG TPA: inositol monophosphatase family protein [Bacteroidales bacterium]|nr:inositol monophosphatase family protein [Bacteroidales bacterium]HLN53501.1 inositol monophosphatase family protein [Lentimicrobium sp.]
MNDSTDYKEICLGMRNCAKEAGKYIQQQADQIKQEQIEEKSAHNYVTYVDKKVEEMLVEGLRKILPDAGFITEEDTDSSVGERFQWIIDPLDGTTNFIHQVPVYCVSIALQEKNEIVAGVIYEVNLDECFYAWKNSPAYLNGKEIHISKNLNFDTALLATGFPYYDYGRMEEYLDVFREMMKSTAGLRRLGSAAADMAYVAAGRFEGFYEYGLHPWDVAAGVIIVKQAGGIVTDFKGGNDAIFGKELICGNKGIHNEMKKIIGKYFKPVD